MTHDDIATRERVKKTTEDVERIAFWLAGCTLSPPRLSEDALAYIEHNTGLFLKLVRGIRLYKTIANGVAR